MTRRRQRLAEETSLYLHQVGRKKPKGGGEPNDRKDDHAFLRKLRSMRPEDLHAITTGAEEEDGPEAVVRRKCARWRLCAVDRAHGRTAAVYDLVASDLEILDIVGNGALGPGVERFGPIKPKQAARLGLLAKGGSGYGRLPSFMRLPDPKVHTFFLLRSVVPPGS